MQFKQCVSMCFAEYYQFQYLEGYLILVCMAENIIDMNVPDCALLVCILNRYGMLRPSFKYCIPVSYRTEFFYETYLIVSMMIKW